MWGVPAGRAVVAPLRRGGPCGRPRVAGSTGTAIARRRGYTPQAAAPCLSILGSSAREEREAARPAAGAAGSDLEFLLHLMRGVPAGRAVVAPLRRGGPCGRPRVAGCTGTAIARRRGYTPQAPAPCLSVLGLSSREEREAARPAAGAAGSDLEFLLHLMWGVPAGRAVVAPLRRGGPCGRPRVAGCTGTAIARRRGCTPQAPAPCLSVLGLSSREAREAARPAAGAAGSDLEFLLHLMRGVAAGRAVVAPLRRGGPCGRPRVAGCTGTAIARRRGCTPQAAAPCLSVSRSSSREEREAARPAAGAAGSGHRPPATPLLPSD